MCGITAMFSMEKEISEVALKKSMERLFHRGPDAQRYWISPDKQIGLTHARLGIIDLKTGNQPLVNEDGRIRAVVNGEFYEYLRIRQDLEKIGHQFKTRSDSEILIHLYEEYGAHALQYLRGEFAFIIWDDKNKLLFAARDRFGIKPLHYTFSDGILYLASEAKALFAAGVRASWDCETVFTSHIFQFQSQERTFFKNIFQIPPGHYLLAQKNHHKFVKYWDFDYPRATDIPTQYDEQEYIEQFRNKLREAIQVRLQSDVPLSCYLSGGIDSCSILGATAELYPHPLNAFTLGFEESEYDETAIAKEMASLVGTPFNLISVKQKDLAENFKDAIWHGESLLFNTHAVAKFLLSRAVNKAGYKVVLTGEGSDEILAGYPAFRQDLLLQNNQAQNPETIDEMLKQLRENNRITSGLLIPDNQPAKADSVERILGYTPSIVEAAIGLGNKFKSFLSEDFYNLFKEQDALRIFLDTLSVQRQLKGRDRVNQSLYLWSKSMLPGYILVNLGDRMEMAHSVEGRVPFLDHHLIEFVKTIPISLKIKGITEKYILREAMRPYLTDTVYKHQKHPFLAPPACKTLDKSMKELLQDTLRSQSFASLPFYDQTKVIATLDQSPYFSDSVHPAMDAIFVKMLSTCVLQEQFGL